MLSIELFADGYRVGTATREFDLSTHTIYHAGMQLHREQQGHGIGKTLLRNSMRLYRTLRFSRILIRTGLDMGGYVWARYGFRPTDESWRVLRLELDHRLRQVRDQVSAETRRIVQEALNDPEGSAIWPISDLTEATHSGKLGFHLLAGTTWDGYLDLGDQDAMDRFDAYVGEQRSEEM